MQTSGCGRRRATIYQNWKVVQSFFHRHFLQGHGVSAPYFDNRIGKWGLKLNGKQVLLATWLPGLLLCDSRFNTMFFFSLSKSNNFKTRLEARMPRPGENKGDCSFSPSMNDFCWQIAKETFACHVLVRWCARSNWSMVMMWRMWKKRQPLDFHKFIEKLPHGSFSTIFLLKLPCVLRLLCSLSLWGLAKQQAHGKNPIFAPRKIAM